MSLSRAAIAALSIGALSSGCIVYDYGCETDDKLQNAEDDADTVVEIPDGDSDEGEDLVVAPALFLSPDAVAPGAYLITSLALENADVDFVFADIAALSFGDTVAVCSQQVRTDELLLSLAADGGAALGFVDLEITLADGSILVVTDALEIVDDGLVDDVEDTGGGGFVDDTPDDEIVDEDTNPCGG